MNTITTTEYKAATLLMFLIAHDKDHAQRLRLNLDAVQDVKGKLSIEGQKVTVVLDNDLTFTSEVPYEYYTLQIPPVENEEGVLYRRNDDNDEYPKAGETDCFFIAQYPTFFGERGRIVVDFWIDNRIVGVFKTNSSNFGAGGRGAWAESA